MLLICPLRCVELESVRLKAASKKRQVRSGELGCFDYRPDDRRLPDRVRGMLPRGRTPCRPSVSARSESIVVRFQGFTPQLHFPTSARSLRARSLLLEPAIMDTMKLSLLYEKFMVAVEVLATSPASLQRRLEGAYRSFIDVEPKDFDDEEMRATFEQIRSRITRVPDGPIDSIAATCREMSDQEAAEVADFLLGLFLRIAEKHHSSRER
jgi:hypothetical protein